MVLLTDHEKEKWERYHDSLIINYYQHSNRPELETLFIHQFVNHLRKELQIQSATANLSDHKAINSFLKGLKVLDIGCGSGATYMEAGDMTQEIAGIMKRELCKEVQYIPLDYDAKAKDAAIRKLWETENYGRKWSNRFLKKGIVTDAYACGLSQKVKEQLGTNKFSVVIAGHVAYGTDNVPGFVENLRSCMADHGIAIAMHAHSDTDSRKIKRRTGLSSLNGTCVGKVSSRTGVKSEDISKAMLAAGMSVIDINLPVTLKLGKDKSLSVDPSLSETEWRILKTESEENLMHSRDSYIADMAKAMMFSAKMPISAMDRLDIRRQYMDDFRAIIEAQNYCLNMPTGVQVAMKGDCPACIREAVSAAASGAAKSMEHIALEKHLPQRWSAQSHFNSKKSSNPCNLEGTLR